MSFIFIFIATLSFATGDPVKPITSFTGQVVESGTSESLTGVKVSIKGTELFTFTDRDGNFEFSELPEGEFQVQFSLVSFNTQLISVTPMFPTTESLLIELNPR